MPINRAFCARALPLLIAVLLSGCAFLPAAGPSRSDVEGREAEAKALGVHVVDLTPGVAKQLQDFNKHTLLSSVFAECRKTPMALGPGDVLEIIVWETPPASLFMPQVLSESVGAQPQQGMVPTRFPEQQINQEGTISIPFAGHIRVAGLTLKQVEQEIYKRLKGKANEPQIMARLIKNITSTVTVVGEVHQASVLPLTPKCERILDVLAAAGGTKHAVNKLMVQLTRDGKIHSLPLDKVIKDHNENLVLEAGDVITVHFQPHSFTALGATGKNAEVEFESVGISLTQALARSGGVLDERGDVQGVYIFRYENADAVKWGDKPAVVTPENKVPVVYKIDLRDPATFFAAQSFPIKDKDMLYVSNAPSVQLMKFLQLVGAAVGPAAAGTANAFSISRGF